MRIISRKVVFVLLFTIGTISIVSATCGSDGSINSYSNGCSYPACSSTLPTQENVDEWKCVHDSSFCTNEEFVVPASDVLSAGRICSCKDILNYPSLIGTCNNNGFYSPMLTDDDCVNGTSVCELDESNKFLLGDTNHPFTACDLKCDFEKNHESVVPDDTYKGCSFPKFQWTVASMSEYSSMQDHHYEILDNTLYIGGTIVPLDPRAFGPSALEFTLKGPFDKLDPSSKLGGANVSEVVQDVAGVLPKKCAVALVKKDTGEPTDIFTLSGTGTCHINSMETGKGNRGGNNSVIVAGGHHSAGGELNVETMKCKPVSNTLGAADTICESGETKVTAHNLANTAFVFLMEPSGKVRWLVQPWLAIINQEGRSLEEAIYETSVTGVSVDEIGDVYITGYRIEQGETPIYCAMLSKHSGTDGGIYWVEEFPGVKHVRNVAQDASEGALYLNFEIPTSTKKLDALDITCNPASMQVQGCSVLARVSTNSGSLHWARYAHGISGDDVAHYGEVKLAHPSDGPYVYAAFNGVGTLGPSSLDFGTSYSGCKSADGTMTLEIDEIFDSLTVPLNPTICTDRGLGTYFDRTSDEAIPSHVATTLAKCGGFSNNSHCLVKYHKLTGLPIWGSVTPQIHDFEPVANGIIITGSSTGPTFFDTVRVSSPEGSDEGPGEGRSMVYQSKIDLDGRGIYVQSIIADKTSATRAGLSQDSDSGDMYIGFSTEASRTYLGPGHPNGFVQDLELKNACDVKGTSCNSIQRITVAKLGAEQTPSCISSCGNDENTVIEGTCFIDQVCYENKDTAERIGLPCMTCDPTLSQTEWTVRDCSITLAPTPTPNDNSDDGKGDAPTLRTSSSSDLSLNNIDDSSDGGNIASVPFSGIIIGAILGLALVLIVGNAYRVRKRSMKQPIYVQPQFFPIEADMI